MQKVACREVGISSTCDFEATGATVDEAVDQELEHVKSAHGEELAAMGMDETDARAAIAQKVRGADEGDGAEPAGEDAGEEEESPSETEPETE